MVYLKYKYSNDIDGLKVNKKFNDKVNLETFK